MYRSRTVQKIVLKCVPHVMIPKSGSCAVCIGGVKARLLQWHVGAALLASATRNGVQALASAALLQSLRNILQPGNTGADLWPCSPVSLPDAETVFLLYRLRLCLVHYDHIRLLSWTELTNREGDWDTHSATGRTWRVTPAHVLTHQLQIHIQTTYFWTLLKTKT